MSSVTAATPAPSFEAIKAAASFVPPGKAPPSGSDGGGGGGDGGKGGDKKKKNKNKKDDFATADNDEEDTRVADAGIDVAEEERIEPVLPADVKLDKFCEQFEFDSKWKEGKMKGFYTRKLTVDKKPFALRFPAQLMFTPDFDESGQYAKEGQSLTTQWRIPPEVRPILEYKDAYYQHIAEPMKVGGKIYTPLIKPGGFKDKTIKKQIDEGNFTPTGKEERHESYLEIELPRARKGEPLKRKYFVPILDPQNNPLLISKIPELLTAGRKFLIDVEFPHVWKNALRWGAKKQIAMIRQEPYVSSRTVTKAPAPIEMGKRKSVTTTTAPPPPSASVATTTPPPPPPPPVSTTAAAAAAATSETQQPAPFSPPPVQPPPQSPPQPAPQPTAFVPPPQPAPIQSPIQPTVFVPPPASSSVPTPQPPPVAQSIPTGQPTPPQATPAPISQPLVAQSIPSVFVPPPPPSAPSAP